MPAVRLGKMVLRWCMSCDLPILNLKSCALCGNPTSKVTHTPPGDIRPAFEFDIDLIKNTIDKQFGEGCGEDFIPTNKVVILNRAPDLDRLDEVIFNGKVQGAMKFDLFQQKFRFMPRVPGAKLFLSKITRSFVIVDDGVINPILTSSNVLAPGIEEVSPGIEVGDDLVVLSKNKMLLGVGSAYMSGSEMEKTNHGLAVKVRWHEDKEHYFNNPNHIISDNSANAKNPEKEYDTTTTMDENHQHTKLIKNSGWKLTLKANKPELDRIIQEANEFIHDSIERNRLPLAVSFSGGKDSLAVLMLVLNSDIKPKLFFIDTGLEFPETIDHVKNISKKFGLELIIGKPTNTFWDGLKYFGPPGKDYRWCCKTCKLGPTTRQIKQHFPNGVLMFIGQRRYESQQRANKEMIWHNPWVPGQVGASPIQHWSALHIWLYLFEQNVEFNSLYEQGLERIGCWLCPASDLADFRTVSELHPDYYKWQEYLKRHSKSRALSPFWLQAGLWRWKKLPKGIKKSMQEKKIEFKEQVNASSVNYELKTKIEPNSNLETGIDENKPLQLYLADGISDCKFGLSQEGVFNKELDMNRVVNIANILGEVVYNSQEGYCTIDELIDIYPEGGIVVKGKNLKDIKKRVKELRAVVFRAMECLGCGICIGRCENQALELDSSKSLERVKIIVDLCTHCGNCLGPCPVINYDTHESFEM